METNTQQLPGYYAWSPSGKQVTVHLSLNVVDRMNIDIMRGFGAVPKRGAEVGGVLLGSVESADAEGKLFIRIEDFVAVACSYARGPSYLLSEEERRKLDAVVDAAEGNSKMAPVGYYRSHTRDGALTLGEEDIDLMERDFPDPSAIVLLVKPFATKVGVAGIFIREESGFPAQTSLEFPFRRRDMTGEEAPPRRPLQDRQARSPRVRESEMLPDVSPLRPPREVVLQEPERAPLAQPLQHSLPPSLTEPSPPPEKRSFLWFPLCLLFLVLGVALGYQAALTFAPQTSLQVDGRTFALNLSAGRNSDTLTVRWDRDSAVVRNAQRGMLEIQDGDFSKPVPLDSAQLREGTIVYQNTSPMVTFRLVVFVTPVVTISETVDWVQ